MNDVTDGHACQLAGPDLISPASWPMKQTANKTGKQVESQLAGSTVLI